ncbi:GNAT family N-acetyltransferase [Candidatus Saccharibacteria bacterium]|nr:GNAT family N-acetyltransferase [Candidatus Saccharibacteria bacterium]
MSMLRYEKILAERKDIEQLYLESFPEEERYSFWAIIQRAQSENIDFFAVYNDSQLIGFTYLIYRQDITYVFYLAVAPSLRNHGYGSQILKGIIEQNQNNKILLCIEYPDDELKIRRRNFYLRNGMHSTGVILENFGLKYEFLCSQPGYQPSAETISEIYKTLADNSEAGLEIRKNLETENIRLGYQKRMTL